MSERTPLPWTIGHKPFAFEGKDIGTHAVILDAENKGVALMCQSAYANDEPNAEFIVRACNSYDDLLAALEEAMEEHTPPHHSCSVCIYGWAAIERARNTHVTGQGIRPASSD